MDPIHPIVPRPPAIPTIAGGQEPDRLDRAAHEQREQRQREQARREQTRREQARRERERNPGGDGSANAHSPPEGEGPRHIDVRA